MEGQRSVGSKLLERMETKGDVTFLVGPEGKEEEIKSFVNVLSAFSSVFETMFNDDWKSQQNVIKLPDIDPTMFRLFLNLVFTDNVKDDHLSSAEMDMGEILHVLYIAKKYDVEDIQSICRNAVRKRMGIRNAVLCYETLQNKDETELEKTAFDFIIAHTEKLLKEDSFTELSLKTLTSVLNFEALSVPEVPLFIGVCRWAESKCTENNMEINGENIRKMLGDLLFLIRFPVMTIQEFYKTVPPMGILTPEEIVQISNCIALKGDSSFANNCPFSAKNRPNVKNELELPAVKKPVLENCFTYTPRDDISLSRVIVSNSCNNSRYCGSRWCSSNYSLRLCIRDGSHDILPKTERKDVSYGHLSFNLETAIELEENKSYCIYYEIEDQSSTLPARIVVRGGTLEIHMQRC